ncbi:hypothetical protein PR048_015032 [Dryococelus australis]|uniref:Uncharacterized protein n=1 Tax=Dryococelus australis TaxID=614101 RepID=A0ABQ9HG34_9NEOP|nr:hypothetical protein PR048_015032 [Dryococelus australis]
MKVIEVSLERRRNEKGRGNGRSPRKPDNQRIIPTCKNLVVTRPAGIEPSSPRLRGEQANRSATAAPLVDLKANEACVHVGKTREVEKKRGGGYNAPFSTSSVHDALGNHLQKLRHRLPPTSGVLHEKSPRENVPREGGKKKELLAPAPPFQKKCRRPPRGAPHCSRATIHWASMRPFGSTEELCDKLDEKYQRCIDVSSVGQINVHIPVRLISYSSSIHMLVKAVAAQKRPKRITKRRNSISGVFALGFSRGGIVPDDAAGLRVFLGGLLFPHALAFRPAGSHHRSHIENILDQTGRQLGPVATTADQLRQLCQDLFRRTSGIRRLYVSEPDRIATCLRGTGAQRHTTRLGRSPPTSAIQVRSPAGSLSDFCMWESCWTMSLAGVFSRGTPVYPALACQRRSILGSHFMPCPGMTGTYGSQLESPRYGLIVYDTINTATIVYDTINTAAVVYDTINTAAVVYDTINTAAIVYDTINTATIVYDTINTAAIVYDTINTAAVVYDTINTAAVVYDTINTAAIVYDTINTAIIVYDTINTAAVVYDTINTAAVVYDTINTAAVVYDTINTAAIVYDTINTAAIGGSTDEGGGYETMADDVFVVFSGREDVIPDE